MSKATCVLSAPPCTLYFLSGGGVPLSTSEFHRSQSHLAESPHVYPVFSYQLPSFAYLHHFTDEKIDQF